MYLGQNQSRQYHIGRKAAGCQLVVQVSVSKSRHQSREMYKCKQRRSLLKTISTQVPNQASTVITTSFHSLIPFTLSF